MKAQKFIVILVLSVISISLLIFAHEPTSNSTKRATENLISGIESENNGVMKSSIYLAGKYKVYEATDALLKVLEKDVEPSTAILVSFALYQIGDTDAMMKVLDKAANSDSLRIQNVLSAIALKYFIKNDLNFVLM